MTGIGYARSTSTFPDTNAVACFPTHFLTGLPFIVTTQVTAPPEHRRSQLERAQWSEIAKRARFESLRDLAVEYGVSHQTISNIVHRERRNPYCTVENN